MAKLKLSKTELKRQRDLLKRFQRFLPTLELKKEQLIMELRRIEHAFEECAAREQSLRDDVRAWVQLFSEPVQMDDKVRVVSIITSEGNIAGVRIPVFERVEFETAEYDLYVTPPWVDRGIELIQQLASLQAEREVLVEQRNLINRELRTTIQRINLFEKVKIPECRNNIRKIQIFMGDQQANAVARGKIAKNKISLAQIDTKA
jgi:V/A-type H+-transporting ATPase subunit D